MKVKDALGVLKRAKEIRICFGGSSTTLDTDDPFLMDAFSQYAVDEIAAHDDIYEINIAMRPVKEGVA